MADPKGYHLYVNLGAAQTRRRLKGFGHGVRKVQSAGRQRALIIHTATGLHLSELEARFADVGCSSQESALDEPIARLKNIGPASAAWLRDVGVATIGELDRLGPVAAYRLVRQRYPQAGINLLWALAAGQRDLDWRRLPETIRQRLRKEAEQE